MPSKKKSSKCVNTRLLKKTDKKAKFLAKRNSKLNVANSELDKKVKKLKEDEEKLKAA